MSSRIAEPIAIANAVTRPCDGPLAALRIRLQAVRARYAANHELVAMSAGELADMGITRHDVSRLFDSRLAPEFRARGNGSRMPDTAGLPATVNPMPQGSAVISSLASQP